MGACVLLLCECVSDLPLRAIRTTMRARKLVFKLFPRCLQVIQRSVDIIVAFVNLHFVFAFSRMTPDR